jgi:hypothetical protein
MVWGPMRYLFSFQCMLGAPCSTLSYAAAHLSKWRGGGAGRGPHLRPRLGQAIPLRRMGRAHGICPAACKRCARLPSHCRRRRCKPRVRDVHPPTTCPRRLVTPIRRAATAAASLERAAGPHNAGGSNYRRALATAPGGP